MAQPNRPRDYRLWPPPPPLPPRDEPPDRDPPDRDPPEEEPPPDREVERPAAAPDEADEPERVVRADVP